MRTASLALAALTLTAPMLSGAAADDFAWPDTPIGERAKAFVAAHNAGTQDDLRGIDALRAESSKKQVSIEKLLPQLVGLRATLGELEPVRVLSEGEHELVVLVRASAAGLLADFSVTCESREPHGLLSFTLTPSQASAEPVDWSDWSTLAELLALARDAGDLPAVAVAIVEGDAIVESAVLGERRRGGGAPVEKRDRFHVGSVTKAITATMIGRLVERGVLAWDVTLGEALGDVEMHAQYRDVTLAQLLRHRGGVPAYTSQTADEMRHGLSLRGKPRDKRAAFVREVLAREPAAPPGTKTLYSNAGYSVAAHVAERAADEAWEALLAKHVFEPLAMRTAGIGWPATPERRAQPHGHRGQVAQAPDDEYSLGAYLGPAGDVHCSIEDLARFARLHLRGLDGEDGALKSETIRALHVPPPGADYAAGWVVVERSGTPVHWHNGSAGTFYSLVALFPEHDRAVVFCTNVAERAEGVAWNVVDAIAARRGVPEPAAK